jgi:hypothetical protein
MMVAQKVSRLDSVVHFQIHLDLFKDIILPESLATVGALILDLQPTNNAIAMIGVTTDASHDYIFGFWFKKK